MSKRARTKAARDTTSALDKDWMELCLAEYADGASDSEVSSVLQLTQSEFNQLLASDDDFKDIIEYGRELAKAFWYGQARANLKNKMFQTTLWYAVMKNRYGWSEKSTLSSDVPVSEKTDDELRQEIQDLMKKYDKVDNAGSNVRKLRA